MLQPLLSYARYPPRLSLRSPVRPIEIVVLPAPGPVYRNFRAPIRLIVAFFHFPTLFPLFLSLPLLPLLPLLPHNFGIAHDGLGVTHNNLYHHTQRSLSSLIHFLESFQ